MTNRLACLALTFAVVANPLHAQPAAKPIEKRADLFGDAKVWDLHLKLGAKEYQGLEPKTGIDWAALFGKKEEKKDEKLDVHKTRGMGNQYPYVKGEITFAGQTIKDVGVRYKGNSSYNAAAGQLRRPFKIDVNHYDEDQRLHGLSGFALANGAWDPSRLRDALAYHVFRAAGLPASRTAFVKLRLTVEGKYDDVYVGLYTMLEPIDKTFLRERFGDGAGMLLKPEHLRGLDYLGQDWKPYGERYHPKREPTEAQKRRLIDFVRLVNKGDDATFDAKIGDYLDVDEFLRFAAVNAALANLDSFFCTAHNYYLYLNPKDDRFHFIPWDLDLAFGGFVFAGVDQAGWTIAEPYIGRNRLTERLLAKSKYAEALRKHFKSLVDGPFNPKETIKALDAMEAVVKPALVDEPALKPNGAWLMSGKPMPPLRTFLERRHESIVAQLDGRSEGKVLRVSWPFDGLNAPAKKVMPKEKPDEK